MAGAASPKTINNNDITNIDVPAMLPITFSVLTPFVDTYKNTRNIINTIDCKSIGFNSFKVTANSPDGLTAQERATIKPSGF
ncbi:hypothetical protein SDC9_117986 [bioreactor metagenome]|uniref:Uncharacterized protein n=1 Tax=bioreactor metagenome TaxID=1076179 RepID=A0A645C6S8_9ZZZZ